MVRVAFVHPDLGIGGAERLVVDAGLALKEKDHSVVMFTAHHDPNHCFSETKDGSFEVICAGDWLPRTICGRLYALCTYMRMMYLATYIIICHRSKFDLFFCDLVSACIPILKLTGAKVLFYCHFPDQLLTRRDWWVKKWYRKPLDWWEEKTTGMAHEIVVNSNFTAKIFKDTFTTLNHRKLTILYPSLHFGAFDAEATSEVDLGLPSSASFVLASINRYERKKNVALCLDALHSFLRHINPSNFEQVHLIIAGGYDERVTENKEYYDELRAHAIRLGLEDHVTFLRSVSHETKLAILKKCSLLLYTPDKEHFGIVPLEAMYMETPVIATNSGGPLETIVSGETGYLTSPDGDLYAERLKYFFYERKEIELMGKRAKQRVISKFSFGVYSDKLDGIVRKLVG